MNWFGKFLTSSIGQKVVMSLTGLFLISFLVVHLAGNLQLLKADEGEAFNLYARFMTTNLGVKAISYLLYAGIILHTIQGIALMIKNRRARGTHKYAVKKTRTTGTSAFASSNMGWLGIIIFIFLLIHLWQFWLPMKMGRLEPVAYADGDEVYNLYTATVTAFSNPFFVIFYVVSMVVVGFHLWHGFQSAFQSLGLNHKKYTPFIKALGKLTAVALPLGFAVIPVYMYFILT